MELQTIETKGIDDKLKKLVEELKQKSTDFTNVYMETSKKLKVSIEKRNMYRK